MTSPPKERGGPREEAAPDSKTHHKETDTTVGAGLNQKSARPKAFIPAWLNTAKLPQAEFRVYCCLAARADIRTGIAWPKAETIASDCFMARRTVWKSLKFLEANGYIEKTGKPFGNSNRYRILVPIGANEAPIEGAPTVANEAPIETLPIGANEAPPIGSPFASSIGANEAPGKTTKKGNQRKTTNSLEGIQFAVWFKSSLPDSINLGTNWQQSFAKTHDDMVRLDNRTTEQIREVCQWARTDDFWKSRFLSPLKLRDRNKNGIQYFDFFAEQMKQPTGPTSRPVNLGRRAQYPQEQLELP